MLRKAIGLTILILGCLISLYGIYIFGSSIYYGVYLSAQSSKFGYADAAGLGFFYGLIVMSIGFVVAAAGNLVMLWEKSPIHKLLFGKNK